MVRFSNVISAIDTHTEAEPTRIITAGLPPIPGATMAEKHNHVASNQEFIDLRHALLLEPRGHGGMFGAILTAPCRPEASWGLIFMSRRICVTMCGHATIGVAMTLVETGMVKPVEPETTIVFDTAAGLVSAHVAVNNGRVRSVWIENVPAFLYKADIPLEVLGKGQVTVDIAWGGNFFCMVDAAKLGLEVVPENLRELNDWGNDIRDALNLKETPRHPIEASDERVSLVEIYGKPSHPEAHARNIVISVEGFDRSPCGTGTSAKMATLYAKGKLKLGEEFVYESITGTIFRGQLLREEKVGEFTAVVPRISGAAYITGFQQFVIDPDDPLKHGFLV